MKTTKYSKVYRIIHWAIVTSFLILLSTIFLRMNWMNKHNIASIIQEYLNTTDQVLSQKQLLALAKKIRHPMWEWHIYIGYVLTGLFCIRFILPAFGQMKIQNPLDKTLSIKEKIQKWTYIIFYISVIISLLTGLGLIVDFIPNELKDPMGDIHVLSLYYLVAFIFIHLSGVLFAEFTEHKGIISRIISGSKD